MITTSSASLTDAPSEVMAPNFLGLPIEIRLHIYAYVFKGSKVVLKPYEAKSLTSFTKQSASESSTTPKQWQILQSCKQCYDEGRVLFYERSTFYTFEPHATSVLDSNYRLSHLAGKFSDFLKDHIKTVAVRRFPQRQDVEGLSALLPNLRLCMEYPPRRCVSRFEQFLPMSDNWIEAERAPEISAHADGKLQLTDPNSYRKLVGHSNLCLRSDITFVTVQSLHTVAYAYHGFTTTLRRDSIEILCLVNLNKDKAVHFCPAAYDKDYEDEAMRKVLE